MLSHGRNVRKLVLAAALLVAPNALAAVTPSFQILATPPQWGRTRTPRRCQPTGRCTGRYFTLNADAAETANVQVGAS